MTVEVLDQQMGDCNRDRRFSNSARPVNSNETLLLKLSSNLGNCIIAPKDVIEPSWQVMSDRVVYRRLRFGVDLYDSRSIRPDCGRDGGNKAVASAGNIGDIPRPGLAISERLAQVNDVEAEAAFFDCEIRPSSVDEFALSYDFARLLGKAN